MIYIQGKTCKLYLSTGHADLSGPLIRTHPDKGYFYDLVGVFVLKIGGTGERCVEETLADGSRGRNLNVYVNTMAGQIYSFIMDIVEET